MKEFKKILETKEKEYSYLKNYKNSDIIDLYINKQLDFETTYFIFLFKYKKTILKRINKNNEFIIYNPELFGDLSQMFLFNFHKRLEKAILTKGNIAGISNIIKWGISYAERKLNQKTLDIPHCKKKEHRNTEYALSKKNKILRDLYGDKSDTNTQENEFTDIINKAFLQKLIENDPVLRKNIIKYVTNGPLNISVIIRYFKKNDCYAFLNLNT